MLSKKKKSRLTSPRNILVAVVTLLTPKLKADMKAIRDKFPNKYASPTFIEELEAEALAVQQLPQPESRIAPRKETLLAITDMIPDILSHLRMLRQYITLAYGEKNAASYFETAKISTPWYEKVRQKKRDIISDIFEAAIDFVAKNEKKLEDDGSMSPLFLTDLTSLSVTFNEHKTEAGKQYKARVDESLDVINQTNALYNRVQGILKDAQSVFYTDVEKRESYAYRTLEAEFNPKKAAGGVGFGLKDALNSRNVVGAEVKTQYLDRMVVSNKQGRVRMSNLPKGTYDFEINHPGFARHILQGVSVRKGVTTFLADVPMQRLPEGKTAAEVPTVYLTPVLNSDTIVTVETTEEPPSA